MRANAVRPYENIVIVGAAICRLSMGGRLVAAPTSVGVAGFCRGAHCAPVVKLAFILRVV